MEVLLYTILTLCVLGVLAAIVLYFVARKFRVEEDPRIDVVEKMLPGANCGGCGFAGCGAYAQAVLDGKAPIGLCAAGGAEAAKKMSEIMGVQAVEVEKTVAMVKCRGKNHLAKGVYDGIADCRSAMFVTGNGPTACPSGCLGFGTCVSVCKFDAIHIVEGVARVDADKCTGCMQCVQVCPRKVIVPVSYHADIIVACSNHERGALTRKVCDVGCIGCHLCERQCDYDAIHVLHNLSTIDYNKCVSCGRCAAVCPRHLISDSNLRTDMDAVPAMQR